MPSLCVSPFRLLRWSARTRTLTVFPGAQDGAGDNTPMHLLSIDGIDLHEIVKFAVAQDGATAMTADLAARFPAYMHALAMAKGSRCFVTDGGAFVEVELPLTGEHTFLTLRATAKCFYAAVANDQRRMGLSDEEPSGEDSSHDSAGKRGQTMKQTPQRATDPASKPLACRRPVSARNTTTGKTQRAALDISPFSFVRFSHTTGRLRVYAPEMGAYGAFLVSVDGVHAAALVALACATRTDTAHAVPIAARLPSLVASLQLAAPEGQRCRGEEQGFVYTGHATVTWETPEGEMRSGELEATQRRYEESVRQEAVTTAVPTRRVSLKVSPFSMLSYDRVRQVVLVHVPEVPEPFLQLEEVDGIAVGEILAFAFESDGLESFHEADPKEFVARFERYVSELALRKGRRCFVWKRWALLHVVNRTTGAHDYLHIPATEKRYHAAVAIWRTECKGRLVAAEALRSTAEERGPVSWTVHAVTATLMPTATEGVGAAAGRAAQRDDELPIVWDVMLIYPGDDDTPRTLLETTHPFSSAAAGESGVCYARSPFCSVWVDPVSKRLMAAAPELWTPGSSRDSSGSTAAVIQSLDGFAASELLASVRESYGEASLYKDFATNFPFFVDIWCRMGRRDCFVQTGQTRVTFTRQSGGTPHTTLVQAEKRRHEASLRLEALHDVNEELRLHLLCRTHADVALAKTTSSSTSRAPRFFTSSMPLPSVEWPEDDEGLAAAHCNSSIRFVPANAALSELRRKAAPAEGLTNQARNG